MIGTIITMFIGLGMAAPFVFLMVRRYDWKKNGVAVQGTVLRVETSKGKKGRTYRPVYKYTLPSGREMESGPSFFTDRDSVRDLKVGSVEPILVHRDDPARIKMVNYTFVPLYIVTALFAVIGLLLFLMALSSL